MTQPAYMPVDEKGFPDLGQFLYMAVMRQIMTLSPDPTHTEKQLPEWKDFPDYYKPAWRRAATQLVLYLASQSGQQVFEDVIHD